MNTPIINIETLVGQPLMWHIIATSQTEHMDKALLLQVSLDPMNPCNTISRYNLIVGNRGVIYTSTEIFKAITEYNKY